MSDAKTVDISFKETPEKFCKYLGHDLSGALNDIQHNGIDEVCADTITRVISALSEIGEGKDVTLKLFVEKGVE